MKRSKFTDSQIIDSVKRVDSGISITFSLQTYGEVRDFTTWEILVVSGLKFASVTGLAF